MPRPSVAAVLFDGTSSTNTAFDTGDLNTIDYDSLAIEVIPSGAAGASTLSFYDSAFSTSSAIRAVATPATAAVKTTEWSPGAQPTATGEWVGGQGGAVPALIRIGIGALGAGITARIRVIGLRLFRGVEGQATGVKSSYADPLTHAVTHSEV